MRLIPSSAVVALCVAAWGPGVRAQQDSLPMPDVVQVSGMVVTGDSLTPLPFATVYRARDQRGTMTDVRGFFSLPALEGDTIEVSSVGYIGGAFVIPEATEEGRHRVVQSLRRDTVVLEEAFIYPWPTRERFRSDFLSLDVALDAYSLGNQRLNDLDAFDRLVYIGDDAQGAVSAQMQQQAIQAGQLGGVPTISLLNPVAWAQFFQALRNGDLKR
jgi:hypothetical protein